jgi:peptidoglycan biosynthesis protein MviN/MurJ (putative lipid II flippase)
VNQQTEIVLLVVTPLSMLMIFTAPLLISLLLTEEFQTIQTMVRLMGLACIFKALCFPMDYMAYAKGDKNYIMWVEAIWGNLKTFTVISTFYLFFGLNGLGYGALCAAVIDVLVSLILTRWRYGFRLTSDSFHLLVIMLLAAGCCFTAAFIPITWLSHWLMGLSTLACCIYCLQQLDRRMNLRTLLKRRLKTKQ